MDLEFHQITTKYEKLRILASGTQARLTASLAAEGQLHPVLVVTCENSENENEKYVLIDGYHRVAALRTLNRDTVEAIVLPLSESAALIFRHCQSGIHKQSALEDGWLLRDLVDFHEVNQAELSRLLQRSESWVSRRMSLVKELPESAQELVRLGKLSAHAAAKYLVPLARAKRSHCEELIANIAKNQTSGRDLERVYIAWKSGNAKQRQRIVRSPLLFMKTAKELRNEPSIQTTNGTQLVSDDMEILDAVSGRARRRLRSLGEGTLPSTIEEAWKAAQSSFVALTGVMEKRFNAGQRNQDGDSAS